MTTLKELKIELKKATQVVKDMDKEKRSPIFKQLSNYSKNLFNEEYKKAVSDQFDILEKITDLVIDNKVTEQQAISAVKIATKY